MTCRYGSYGLRVPVADGPCTGAGREPDRKPDFDAKSPTVRRRQRPGIPESEVAADLQPCNYSQSELSYIACLAEFGRDWNRSISNMSR
jgi:hypothetical protein